jgi:hypothetical protein
MHGFRRRRDAIRSDLSNPSNPFFLLLTAAQGCDPC